MHDESPKKPMQATPDGVSSSASRLRSLIPAGRVAEPELLGRQMRAAYLVLVSAAIVAGCMRTPDDTLRAFEAAARAAATAGVYTQWGDTVRTNAAGTAIRLSDLPSWGRRLPDLNSVGVGVDVQTDDRIVTLTAGGGFGVWGMAIGPRGYRCNLGRVRHDWTNGIWFFRQ